MNWQEALEQIQSVEFDVNLNVVSGTNAFFRAVAKEPAVLEAYRQMLASGELREDALGRIYDLANQEVDLRFENPNDTPLAVLLWLTYFGAGDFAPMAAALVDGAPQCWYARRLARRILNPPPSLAATVRMEKTPGVPMKGIASPSDVRATISPAMGDSRKLFLGKSRATTVVPNVIWQTLSEDHSPQTANPITMQAIS
jgi:hypothetical protein